MRDKPRILLVDDDPSLLKVLAIRLQRQGYEVKTAESGKKALAALPGVRPHVVITDMRMDGMDGLALFDAIHAREPTLPVIVLTAHGTIPDAVDATQRGVFAYLTKPFERDQLVDIIERALSMFGEPSEAPTEDAEWCSDIITRSSTMETLLREAWMVSQSDASVLIRGESGTGKELLARAIHKASARHERPLVAVNCTAIPDQLFEAELFGHEKGAFTGATHSREGLIKAADKGTLFLDEIGDMPLPFQAKLLRMLQEKEIRAVGSTSAMPVDVRVISATHQNLEDAIAEKTFREDLYYRLNVVTLEIPPLAKRREDIPLLADHLLERARSERRNAAVEVTGFSKEAMELMMAAPWPGNIRQLRNVVDQCVVLATAPLIPASLVQRALRRKEKAFLPFAKARDAFEFEYLTHLLEMTEGNVAQAARLAERNRSEFYKLLHKHDLEPELFRRGDADEKVSPAPDTAY
ncbi:MAG: sigma 54-interacting transcriptional regulator [Gammaproteobacteria bacterium]|nr:sigma 54-interacting transcriptional regulator [Gammaproteobacteria bacterium]